MQRGDFVGRQIEHLTQDRLGVGAELRCPAEGAAKAGGLMSYAVDTIDLHARAASYIDRILKGASPADLPVQNPTKYSLIINLKTAKALGLTIPYRVLAIAGEVIE